jgi:glycosyltransferase involved in cell wall biosynthesis
MMAVPHSFENRYRVGIETVCCLLSVIFMLRLAYFVSHPIQYQAPLLRLIAADPAIQLKVFFYSNFSLQSYQDPGFGQVIKWDVPLTEGYDYQFLDTWGSKQRKSFLQQPIARDIFEQLKQGHFDAVWVHGWSHICSLQAIVAAKRLGIPVLLRGEAHGLKEPRNPVKKWAKKAFLNRLFKTAAGCLYIGTLNRQFYQSYGVSEERLFPVPYAVDNDFFQKQVMLAGTGREALRKSLNLEPGRPIILYAAKLIEKKRPQDLLAAYRLLSSDGVQEPEPYLLFVGDGNLRSHLEAEAKATGWHSIRFLGFRNQSELPAIYDLSDVFVLPSNFEPWGLAVNEVMNAGKAVVVSNKVGSALDLVLEGQNGRTFPVGNSTALAEAIQWALTHAKSAGDVSLTRIQDWGFQQDVAGLKLALRELVSSYV